VVMVPAIRDPFPPAPTPRGLFDWATGPLDLLTHEINVGVQVEQYLCGDGELYPAACETDHTYPDKIFGEWDGVAQSYPFAAYVGRMCGALGQPLERMRDWSRQLLVANEQRLVERGFWGGHADLGTSGALIAATPTDLGAAATVRGGIAALEQWAADNLVSRGIIHARPHLAAWMGSLGLLSRDSTIVNDSAKWTTHMGNMVVYGSGYAGTGPADEAVTATTEYIAVTGRVAVLRSPEIFVADPREVLDRGTNQVVMFAQREYSIVIECAAAMIEVTLA
jgi:hypothetical protein